MKCQGVCHQNVDAQEIIQSNSECVCVNGLAFIYGLRARYHITHSNTSSRTLGVV